MDSSIVGLIGVAIGAFLGLLGTFLTNWLAIRRDHDQWHRDRKADYEKWLRDKLQEIYTNCLHYSRSPAIWISLDLKEKSPIDAEKLAFEGYKLESEYRNEWHKWLNLLAIYHPYPNTPQYQDFLMKLGADKISVQDIIEIATHDPRLQGEFLTANIQRDNS